MSVFEGTRLLSRSARRRDALLIVDQPGCPRLASACTGGSARDRHTVSRETRFGFEDLNSPEGLPARPNDQFFMRVNPNNYCRPEENRGATRHDGTLAVLG
jgi:hypothetical protein